MKFSIFVSVTICFLILCICLHFALGQTQEPELLWSKTFESDITNFGITKDGKIIVATGMKTKSDEKEPTKSVIVSQCGIYFLNENGDVINKKTLMNTFGTLGVRENVYISNNGEFILRHKGYLNEKTCSYDKFEVTLMNQDGKDIWTYLVNEGANAAIANDGEHFVIYGGYWSGCEPTNKLDVFFYFYNSSGALLNSLPIDKFRVNYDGKFSRDGKLFVAVADLVYPESDRSVLLLLDSNGQELWNRELDGSSCGEVAISYDGDRIIASSSKSNKKYLYFFDKRGTLISKQEVSENTSCGILSFSFDSQIVARITGEFLSYYDAFTGKLLWEWKVLQEERGYWIDISYQGEYVSVGCNEKYARKGCIYVFEKNGKMVFSTNKTYFAPVIKFTKDSSKLMVSAGNTIYCFKIK